MSSRETKSWEEDFDVNRRVEREKAAMEDRRKERAVPSHGRRASMEEHQALGREDNVNRPTHVTQSEGSECRSICEKVVVKYHPRHAPPNEREENEPLYNGGKEGKRSSPIRKDVVLALQAKDDFSTRPKHSRAHLASIKSNDQRKRKTSQERPIAEKPLLKRVTIREPNVLYTHVILGQLANTVVDRKEKCTKSNNKQDIIYDEHVDFPNIAAKNEEAKSLVEVLDPYVSEKVSMPNIAAIRENDVVKEKEMRFKDDYPFRYNISQKAQKQINDIVYADVAVATRRLQKRLEHLVEERDGLEKQLQEALCVTRREENYRKETENCQRKLDEMKLQACEEIKSRDGKIRKQTEKEKLVMEDLQMAQSTALNIRAEVKANDFSIMQAQEQVKELTQRNEEICKHAKRHGVVIPEALMFPCFPCQIPHSGDHNDVIITRQ